MQDYMDRICDAVFEVRPFHFIPTIFKMKTNFIIFYAVSNLFHNKLIKAYHEFLKEDDEIAKKAVRRHPKSKASTDLLRSAGEHLREFTRMSSVADGIKMITKFFEGVVSALPDKNAAADDILPAVCDGISRCRYISQHVVSSFQYIAEIWPQEGLSEKTTYILVTCSIAAYHFASGIEDEGAEEDSQDDEPEPILYDETIQMLEDYLDTL